MGVFDFFKGQQADGNDTTTGGRCDRCVYCREMPMFMGGSMRNVLVCELTRRDDGCVRSVRPDESCSRFTSKGL